jgi:hypothetical protein
VHHFRSSAIRLGAFGTGQCVVDDGAMAVLDPGHTGTASAAHLPSFSRDGTHVLQQRGVSAG